MDSSWRREEEFFLRYWSIKSYVLFSIPSSSLSLSLFFSPLERTFRISKDNPCDRNVSRASNVYRANWTKMMKEGKGDVLLPPSPSSRDAKEQILAWKISVGSVKRCKPVENLFRRDLLIFYSCIIISLDKNRSSLPPRGREEGGLHQIYTVRERNSVGHWKTIVAKVLLYTYTRGACRYRWNRIVGNQTLGTYICLQEGGRGRRVNFSGEFSTI